MRYRYHEDASKAKRVHDAAHSAKSPPRNYSANVMLIIREIQKDGAKSLWTIADTLNGRGVRGAKGGKWYATTVRNFIERNKAAADTSWIHRKPHYGVPENKCGVQGDAIVRTRRTRRWVRTSKGRPGKAS